MHCNGIFITGTDTDIGKTVVSSALIKALVQRQLNVIGMKPIASGFNRYEGKWVNSDVNSLLAASNVDVLLAKINRYQFKPAIAPHIAAQEKKASIDFKAIENDVNYCRQKADAVIVEAVGGWHVPLNGYQQTKQDVADLACLLNMPVIMVVGMRLGCINHAILSYQSIRHSQLPILGWVANCCAEEMPYLQENIDTLKSTLDIPLLATIPYLSEPDDYAGSDFTQEVITDLIDTLRQH